MKSAFDTWFRKQHGNRPSRLKIYELHNKYMDAKAQLVAAEDLLWKVNEYEARRESALYAWVVPEEIK